MLVLVLDTSTPAVTAGVVELTEAVTGDAAVAVRAERVIPDARAHAEILTTLVLDCLTASGASRGDLDAVVVGCGPGPFTGLRVGMATAAAFADALDLPLYGVCSLDAIAVGTDAGVLVVTDARRREVYWARYVDGARVEGPRVLAPAALADHLADIPISTVLGSSAHTALFDLPAGGPETPPVAGLAAVAGPALLAGTAPTPPVPLYLRRPDAVPLAERR
ncbi:tRNA (adenosine(37)-N6)-threonylcarbamoyltransferase complex dimerization subunit type 1 TsaB [Williamsia sterculiae]|uniref:tRNA threonylcarbamoyl adenosine modification protein YeaZ n=1 Tax=Williamsia sterculiae TaxID=1344003 RepID=A0A1N7DUK0_9NOCA|nr:tRNA (adenosine(37)-N6)-threonylcarbamoyltransferase complex dimerization subunit type 1 TsaB [Williamsia sterculiae]SIR79490.1 tRNA threonylcarbamoyl adenosine modification protein YeaZ [Williamsia sterculiae]